MCVCVCFLPIHSGLQWTYQPGSHRKKVTQDFPSMGREFDPDKRDFSYLKTKK